MQPTVQCTNGGCTPVQCTAYFSALFNCPATTDALFQHLPHVWKRTFFIVLCNGIPCIKSREPLKMSDHIFNFCKIPGKVGSKGRTRPHSKVYSLSCPGMFNCYHPLLKISFFSFCREKTSSSLSKKSVV